jgi:CheY-like chemotaxis protein
MISGFMRSIDWQRGLFLSRILVIDDSVDLRTVLSIALESEGYTVQLASHGKEALEILHRGVLPQLIILDLMMPVMNGWEFLKERKSLPHLEEIPLVICSATHHDLQSSYPFLKKPVDLDDLLKMVERLSL